MAGQDSDKGIIFDIQRFSLHDGPGIRTTVFMKGCPLRCWWCHNPEGISSQPLLSFLPDKCIGCGFCFKVCPRRAHRMEGGRHVLDREKCIRCGACTVECCSGALELAGKKVTVEEVIREVLKDRPFYETSGGGMTLSGGEPTYQMAFTEALLQAAKNEGLHTCMETCGYADYNRFERLLPLVDQFLFDFKESDPERHLEYTGVSNARILANLRALIKHGASVLLRCPMIPGCNDREDHLEAIAAISRELPNLAGVELMPYHGLGTGKLERFGLDATRHTNTQAPTPATVAAWGTYLRERGVQVVNEG